MKVLHLLASGGIGGIEILCSNYGKYSKLDNIFVFLWGKDDKTYLHMKENGEKVFQLNASKGKPLHMMGQIEKIRKENNVDVLVIHHEITLCYLYVIWLKKIKKVRSATVIYCHCNAEDMIRVNNPKGLKFRKSVLRQALEATDNVIAISQSVKRSLVETFSISEKKIQIIYNGIDLKKFKNAITIKRNFLHSKNYFVLPLKFVYVGRLICEKGVQITLNALANLPKELSWSFDIIGDGPYRDELELLADKLKIKEKVHFRGSRNDIPELLQNYDVFIHMPIWEEGFGITLIEALATGLLCICSAKGGIPEIIENNKDGILVYSDKMLITVLEEVFQMFNEDKILQIRNNGVEKAAKFDIETFTNQLDHFFQTEKY